VTLDKLGNLYGATTYGGSGCPAGSCGTLFEVTQAGAETVLWNFGSAGDGYEPQSGVVFDKKGNLYGTSELGGAYGGGTVVEWTAKGVEKVFYSFGSQPNDGTDPVMGVIFDKKGNLYGTTFSGGAHGYGTVYEVTPKGVETVLYSFGSQPGDGQNPQAGLVFDKMGNLYGTTLNGGANGVGTVFKLTP